METTSVGCSVGTGEGCSVPIVDGTSVLNIDGSKVGNDDGSAVGHLVGVLIDGENVVGDVLVDTVGRTDGSKVDGKQVRNILGCSVGDEDGIIAVVG